ncbi:hypothetical protein BZA70DRAFT_290705 [Myxozyma melibiosi]|uniref:DSC E3 ubiquitin ligase complex subunit 2 n=1 Tax=Myxozyma melibiosi TaxID=54550 RepID=A0ABR1F2T7_9ASCO
MFSATPPGFKHAPVTKLVIIFNISASIITSILGIKHYAFLQFVPHVWNWGQWWRLLVWQFVYLNESEVLFSSLLIYNLRVIERLLGSRKFASLLVLSIGFSLFTAPITLLLLKFIPSYSANYLPSGPTPLVFTVLALYHDLVPSVYKFKISSSSSSPQPHSLTLSDKIFVYLLATQLALSQLPGSLICAFAGWLLGILWLKDFLPLRNFRISPRVWSAIHARGRASLLALSTTPNHHASGIAGLVAAAAAAERTAQQQPAIDPVAGSATTTATPPAAATARTQAGRGLGSQLLDTFRGEF